MSLITMNAAAMRRFDAICAALAARGSGLTLSQIGDAGALARELAGPPDSTVSTVSDAPALVRLLRTRLGLGDDDKDLAERTP